MYVSPNCQMTLALTVIIAHYIIRNRVELLISRVSACNEHEVYCTYIIFDTTHEILNLIILTTVLFKNETWEEFNLISCHIISFHPFLGKQRLQFSIEKVGFVLSDRARIKYKRKKSVKSDS